MLVLAWTRRRLPRQAEAIGLVGVTVLLLLLLLLLLLDAETMPENGALPMAQRWTHGSTRSLWSRQPRAAVVGLVCLPLHRPQGEDPLAVRPEAAPWSKRWWPQ